MGIFVHIRVTASFVLDLAVVSLQASRELRPLELKLEHPRSTIRAHIDPENKFGMADKFSQVSF